MNDPLFTEDGTAVTARNAEYTGTPLTDVAGSGTYADPYLGCNRAASCAPGIGIATDNGECKLQDWTVLDQDGAARNPQDSQLIGGAATTPINVFNPSDLNNTVGLTVQGTGWVENAVA